MAKHQHPGRSNLVARLSAEDRRLLAPHMERITLGQGDVLFEINQPIEYVYFLESGLSSEIATSPEGEQTEVGCVGWEGLSGIQAVLRVDRAAHHTLMAVGGSALRIRPHHLHEAMDASSSLAHLLLRYAHVFMTQIAATVLAQSRYNIEQGLARWLLMGHDRMTNDELPITHQSLSLILGVRRPGVTEALHHLEGEHLIKAQRSMITILDRPRLEERAVDSYGGPEAEYKRLIGLD